MTIAERLREAPPRSWLFVPALRAPEWIPKAIAAGTDAIIVDLEDATAPNEKERAREVVRALVLGERQRPWIFIRANAAPPDALEADLHAAVEAGATGVVIPKVERPDEIARVVRLLETAEAARRKRLRLEYRPAILAMTETARGVLNALAIADAHERVVGLGFGGEDLSADLGIARSRDVSEFATARSLVALAAAAAGVAAVDTPWMDLKDPEGAGREAALARQLGFAGKFVIHPAQVGPVNAAFTPSDAEVARARGIVDAFDRAVASGSGIAVHEGRMIDRPIVAAARRVLARAGLGAGGPTDG